MKNRISLYNFINQVILISHTMEQLKSLFNSNTTEGDFSLSEN